MEKETWLAKTKTDVLSLALGDSSTGLQFKYISNVTVAKKYFFLHNFEQKMKISTAQNFIFYKKKPSET